MAAIVLPPTRSRTLVYYILASEDPACRMQPKSLPFHLAPASRVHIIGAGGIGTSAIAQWLHALGLQVEGSDAVASDITEWLTQHDIPVTVGSPATLEVQPHIFIYSDSVPPSHPLRQLASNRQIPQYSYAEALGELSQGYQTIAIAGSHGKSTTTALAGLFAEALGLNPMVVVGTRVPQWHTKTQLGNFRLGGRELLIVEADEYRNHFHHLAPTIGVITSVDHDHVDFFPTAAHYQEAFAQFVNRIRPDGVLIIEHAAHQVLSSALHNRREMIYAVDTISASLLHLAATQPTVRKGKQYFNMSINDGAPHPLSLRVPGTHMVSNVLAAIGAVRALGGVPEEKLVEAAQHLTETFRSTWRRFEEIGELNQARVFSDYAHHPTEVAALIDSVHDFFPAHRLVLVLQPHHHSRARAFAGDFLRVIREKLSPTDQIVLCEVYGVIGREQAKDTITSQTWARELQVPFVPSLNKLKDTLTPLIRAGDIVVFAGAGDIDASARELIQGTGRRKRRSVSAK